MNGLHAVRWLVLALLGACLSSAVHAEQTASTLFQALRPLVVQVRVIDVASGDKTSIGSGFHVSADGLVATNFHVVELAVSEPAKYRLELIDSDGANAEASVVSVDVLHDLAIMRTTGEPRKQFQLVDSAVSPGERIYSMGNPRDLGMTIIEGNYNGLVKSSRFERLLFSGSLNPGMSGGPAFNENGEVIGVNVATGGDQISFLVPVRHLQRLLERVRTDGPVTDFKAWITQELLRESGTFYGERLLQEWKREPFGELLLPRDLSPDMKCWGHNIDDDTIAYEGFHQHCRSEEYLYLEEDLYTGNFSYDYEWMTTDRLNALQFYAAVERRFVHSAHDNAWDEDDVTNYGCVTDFVDIDDTSWKASICLRRYRNYPGVHDASLVMVSLRDARRAAVIQMSATGIGRENAVAMFEKLMKSIEWTR